MKWGAKKRRAKRAKIEAKETTEMMKHFKIVEKESILTASRKINCYTIEAENIEEAEEVAEEGQIESASEIGIYENDIPRAYYVGGEWTFTE